MFLDKTIERNSKLIEVAFKMHKDGLIEPDTYVIDFDTTVENARKIKEEADKSNVELFFMAKQFGRNPYLCKEFMNLGYAGAVVVDFKEAKTMIDNNIKIGHVGHLVQIPTNMVEEVVKSEVEYITIYSLEKAQEINDAAKKYGIVQKIMLRVLAEGDNLYSGQYGGFYLDELEDIAEKLSKYSNIKIKGLTSFPCFLYNNKTGEIEKTNNIETVNKAKSILESCGDIKIECINLPSATCSNSVAKIRENGGTHGEPGHGLTGTTPYHKYKDGLEIPSIIYLSEVSHNLGDKSYCFGGGHYRRSNMEKAIVGSSIKDSKVIKVIPPTDESIDYHFELTENTEVGDAVIMAFRTQIFVTRSNVAIVKGIASGSPELVGIYDALGKKIK